MTICTIPNVKLLSQKVDMANSFLVELTKYQTKAINQTIT